VTPPSSRYWIVLTTLLLTLSVGGLLLQRMRNPQDAPLPTNPEARLARLTSTLLRRKVEEVHNRTVHLQHAEEGRLLLQEIRILPPSKGDRSLEQ
jgi:hypothetical protein